MLIQQSQELARLQHPLIHRAYLDPTGDGQHARPAVSPRYLHAVDIGAPWACNSLKLSNKEKWSLRQVEMSSVEDGVGTCFGTWKARLDVCNPSWPLLIGTIELL